MGAEIVILIGFISVAAIAGIVVYFVYFAPQTPSTTTDPATTPETTPATPTDPNIGAPKGCTSSNNYWYCAGSDSTGNDITQVQSMNGVDPDLERKCWDDPACVAYNTDRYLKYAVKPQKDWAKGDTGIYIKKSQWKDGPIPNADRPTGCYAVGDYWYCPSVDSGGNDLQKATGTPDEIRGKCWSNAACVAYNSNGYLKAAIKPQKDWEKTADGGLYIKKSKWKSGGPVTDPDAPPGCRSANNFWFCAGYDSGGNDIKKVTGQTDRELQGSCWNEPKCVAYTSGGYLKSAVAPQKDWKKVGKTDGDWGLYIRKSAWNHGPIDPAAPAGCYGVNNYWYCPGKDSSGSDIQQLKDQTPAQLQGACWNEPKCVAYNSSGNLKSAVTPQTQWKQVTDNPDWGLYIKKSKWTATK